MTIKSFGKVFHLFLSNKVKKKKKEVKYGDPENTKIFKNCFNKTLGSLSINRNMECVRESFNERPALTSIDKYATHPSIKNIKTRMISSNFKFVLED